MRKEENHSPSEYNHAPMGRQCVGSGEEEAAQSVLVLAQGG